MWTTDKDGILLALLAPRSRRAPGRPRASTTGRWSQRHGEPAYARIDAAAIREQKAQARRPAPDDVTAESLAGEPITAKLTEAPGNGAAIGGLKVVTELGWFAARPSGTEDVYKIYAESFRGPRPPRPGAETPPPPPPPPAPPPAANLCPAPPPRQPHASRG